MSPTLLLIFCIAGTLPSVLPDDHFGEGFSKLWQSVSKQISQYHNDGDSCDHADRKDHAIDLLREWIKHHHYDAVEKLYHDIYHKDLQDRKKRQWHHYQSNFDEAFTNGNKDPDYAHVEFYLWRNMNQACRTEIMKWIENYAAHHHSHGHHHETQSTTTHAHNTHGHHGHHETQEPTTHAPKTGSPQTVAPTEAQTTLLPTTSALLGIKTSCEVVTFVTALARGTTLTNANAGLCTDGTHSRSEAVVLESCKAPPVSSWAQGVKVMGNCERIPDYTPIGTFSFGTFVQDGTGMAGIITECTQNGFKIAIQLCGHPVDIKELKSGAANPQENADNYYVINF